ncbi:hypothetical protein VNI00_013749 [Paramarasmius palmivorus]|uniref:Cytochrome P450 n=1 Tax=Paramarasmius palmivorus TaxID=297713 RepID=A0AAW0BVL7_9AGAR
MITSVDSVYPTRTQYLLKRVRSDFFPEVIEKVFAVLFPSKEDIRWRAWLKASKSEARRLYVNKLQGQTSQEDDVLGVISRSMKAADPDRQMSSEEALSQMSTIIMAGHETSAHTLTWLFYELARHSADQQRLFEEIKRAREEKGAELTANDYDSMPFLNAVIKETLRLDTIVLRLVREAGEDDVIPLAYPIRSSSGEMLSQIPVTKGQRIITSVAGYNYLKEVWGEDAEEWNPDRHLDSKRATTLGVFGNVMTFSAGVRSCLGWRFAVHEIQTVTTQLVESFQFSIPPGVDIVKVETAFMSPVVRGKTDEGLQMPLKIKLRE